MRAYLTTHAWLDTIPLRVGDLLDRRIVDLRDSTYDQAGTDQQSRRELDEKRYHLIANIWTDDRLPRDLGRWRVVIKDTATDRFPPVFTVLHPDNDIRTEANLTKAIADARNRGDHRMTPEYVRDGLHPLYAKGKLRTQQDLADHFAAIEREQHVAEKAGLIDQLAAEKVEKEALRNRVEELESLEVIQDEEMSKHSYEGQIVGVSMGSSLLAAEEVTIMRSKGPTRYAQLTLADGRKLLKRWNIEQTLARARPLIGKNIATTVWNSKEDPKRWSANEWFEDLYEVHRA